ncbi:hypothetical protein JCM16358_25590 [Halanaerocella petrolearia]
MDFQCIECNLELNLSDETYYLCPNCGAKMYQIKVLNKLQIGDKGVEAVLEHYQSQVNDEKIEELILNEEKIKAKANKSSLRQAKDYVIALFSLLKDDKVANYYHIIAGAALLYIFNPLDLIPDFVLGFGLLDDLVIVMLAVSIIGQKLNQYLDEQQPREDSLFYSLQPPTNKIKERYQQSGGVRTLYLYPDQLKEFGLQILNNNLVQAPQLYIGHPYFYKTLVPIDNFDQYISQDIVQEEINLLSAFGAKMIRYKAHEFEQLDLSATIDFNLFEQIINGEVKANQRGYKYTTQERTLEFERIDNYNLDQIDNLIWYFSNQSNFNDLISNRILADLSKENLKFEHSTSQFLSLDTRANLTEQKVRGAGEISNVIHRQIEYQVEFYPRPQIVEEESKEYYKKVQEKLKERREELTANYYTRLSDWS